MGVINQGILGGFSGKVGPVVGGKWKDVDYMRSYVIPSNPNTVGQQAVRTKFAGLVASARALLTSLLQPFWDYYLSSMSGFNKFISSNYSLSNANGSLAENCIASLGSLEGVSSLTSEFNSGTGDLVITWDGTVFGNGLATDLMCIVCFNLSDKIVVEQSTNVLRSAETETFNIGTGASFEDYLVCAFPYRGTGADFTTASSLWVQSIEP